MIYDQVLKTFMMDKIEMVNLLELVLVVDEIAKM
jgi:hypothetical protein